MPRCGACGADVTFRRSGISEHSLIVDEQPRKDVIVLPRRVARLLDQRVLEPTGTQGDADDVALVVDVWTDHHATCGYAELYRTTGGANIARAKRLASRAEELYQLARELSLYTLADDADGPLHVFRGEARTLVEAIDG